MFTSALSVLFAFGAYYPILKERKLLSTGQATKGIVVYGDGSYPLSNWYNYIVKFEYGSNSYKIKVRYQKNWFSVGEECTVIFDPQNPKIYTAPFLYNWWELAKDN